MRTLPQGAPLWKLLMWWLSLILGEVVSVWAVLAAYRRRRPGGLQNNACSKSRFLRNSNFGNREE